MAASSSSASSLQWGKIGVSSQLEVREREAWGRGVYAATALSTGLEVMRAEPLVHVLSNDVRGQLCDFCLRESQSLLKCGRCKYVRYCSKTCQRGDWRFHKGECGGIARAQPHSPTPLARLVVRCLLVDAEEETQRATEFLCSNEDKLSLEVKEDAATLMVCVRLLLENPETSAMRRAYTLLCKALCNTFTIHGSGLDPIGAGIYVGPSLLNHSCRPNCVAVFNGTSMTVRTIEPVQQGHQLL
ncbi:Histone-lysine N-methyltransferase SMYD3 [Geodia barretti]|uniref:Histone-lysine N-methyltransferase SMYD3 n=2 Tax=Geodia barretti TaxID=519541 RepID=A0AA35X5P7_GEOBA|nr:Histone-lysine N-methyltransferase SMYD3 [Geodia barretti]